MVCGVLEWIVPWFLGRDDVGFEHFGISEEGGHDHILRPMHVILNYLKWLVVFGILRGVIHGELSPIMLDVPCIGYSSSRL
jgi:hypothetical protein